MKLAASILALSLLIHTTTHGQVPAGSVALPDSLGALCGPCHVAWDTAGRFAYVGDYRGKVLVVDAVSFRRVAAIATGAEISGMCLNPRYNKIYCSHPLEFRVSVLDCATNRVLRSIRVGCEPRSLVYNPQYDRVYCANAVEDSITVIDCAADTVIGDVYVGGWVTCLGLDPSGDKLYVGTKGPLAVVDCAANQLVAVVPEVAAAGAIAVSPLSQKVYAVAGDSLCVVDAVSDSFVKHLEFPGLEPSLAYDPVANRLYCLVNGSAGVLEIIDCASDSVVARSTFHVPVLRVACSPAHAKVYVARIPDFVVTRATVYAVDANSGQRLAEIKVASQPTLVPFPASDQVYCLPSFRLGALEVIGCAADSVEGVVPLMGLPATLCLNARENKLYFRSDRAGDRYLGVVDCGTNRVTDLITHRAYSALLAFSETSNKLYCGPGSSEDPRITVYDGAGDSVVSTIPTACELSLLWWHPGMDKLYCAMGDPPSIAVVDCVRDSIVKTINVRYFPPGPATICFVPDLNRLYCFGLGQDGWGLTIVDCARDSVLVDTATGWLPDEVCYAPGDQKIYCVRRSAMYIVDVVNHANVVRLPWPYGGQSVMTSVFCAPTSRKVYWTTDDSYGLSDDSILVIDSKSDTVIHRLTAGKTISGGCLDYTGNYLYITSWCDTLLLVLDSRLDSVVSAAPVHLGSQQPLLNLREGCVYVGGILSDSIHVFSDSVVSGVRAAGLVHDAPCQGPTVMKGRLRVRCARPGELLDVAGRRAAVLDPGQNEVSGLVPGVYFVRSGPGFSAHKVLVVE